LKGCGFPFPLPLCSAFFSDPFPVLLPRSLRMSGRFFSHCIILQVESLSSFFSLRIFFVVLQGYDESLFMRMVLFFFQSLKLLIPVRPCPFPLLSFWNFPLADVRRFPFPTFLFGKPRVGSHGFRNSQIPLVFSTYIFVLRCFLPSKPSFFRVDFFLN